METMDCHYQTKMETIHLTVSRDWATIIVATRRRSKSEEEDCRDMRMKRQVKNFLQLRELHQLYSTSTQEDTTSQKVRMGIEPELLK
jgi:hypothetical protein